MSTEYKKFENEVIAEVINLVERDLTTDEMSACRKIILQFVKLRHTNAEFIASQIAYALRAKVNL